MSVVAITGARGFIGKNCVVRLQEAGHEVVGIEHDAGEASLDTALSHADFLVHLAGVNRPPSDGEFETGNAGWTRALIAALERCGRTVPLVFASSVQADLDNAYGRSKRAAEEALREFAARCDSPVHIWRLPNVFGKWCRPNYNSVVATFCHNIANDLPITINDEKTRLRLVYIDDVVTAIVKLVDNSGSAEVDVEPVYEITLGDLARQIKIFRDSRETLMPGPVGTGLARALHATYLSYLEPVSFTYDLVSHVDPRGMFAEVLRTPDAGQISFFTAHPGVTRGGHYHHSKTEKFVVVQGRGRFGFRNILTGETATIDVSGDHPQVVETIPGWSHDITNIGDDVLVAILWANELFDRDRPDTITAKVLV